MHNYNFDMELIKRLEPCPLCGTPIEIVSSFSDIIIRCPNCRLKSKYFSFDTDISAIVSYWNNRKPLKEIIKSVEESKQQNDKSVKEIRKNCVGQIKKLKQEKFLLEEQIKAWKDFSECDNPYQLRYRLNSIKYKVEQLKKKLSIG